MICMSYQQRDGGGGGRGCRGNKRNATIDVIEFLLYASMYYLRNCSFRAFMHLFLHLGNVMLMYKIHYFVGEQVPSLLTPQVSDSDMITILVSLRSTIMAQHNRIQKSHQSSFTFHVLFSCAALSSLLLLLLNSGLYTYIVHNVHIIQLSIPEIVIGDARPTQFTYVLIFIQP